MKPQRDSNAYPTTMAILEACGFAAFVRGAAALAARLPWAANPNWELTLVIVIV